MSKHHRSQGEDTTSTIRVWGHDLRVSVRPGTDTAALPLLMLMGLGGNIGMWEPFRGQLGAEAGLTTVALDVPGTGCSTTPLLPLPLPVIALMVRSVLNALHLDRVDVIGLSWGGLLAQQLAVSAPRRVRRLVLANTTFGLGSVPGGLDVVQALASTRRYRSAAGLRHATRAFGGSGTASQHHAARMAHPPSSRGYYWQILSLTGWSSLPMIRLIRQPTLLLCGDDDPAIPLVNPRIMARLLPDPQLVVIRGGGHLMLFERTDETVGATTRFLLRP